MNKLNDWEMILYNVENFSNLKNNVIFPNEIFECLILGEDHRFWWHRGVDVIAIFRAIWKTVIYKKKEGASTIAMQLVRTITGNREYTLKRKLREIYYAIKLTMILDKKYIMQMYLFLAYYGWNMDGIENACKILNIDKANITLDGALSLAPSKFGKTFEASLDAEKPSDLDFFIISEEFFNKLKDDFQQWNQDFIANKIKPKNNNELVCWTENQKVVPKNIQRGFLDAWKIPSTQAYSSVYKVSNTMWQVQEKLKGNKINIKKASVRCFDSWSSFICQRLLNLKSTFGDKRDDIKLGIVPSKPIIINKPTAMGAVPKDKSLIVTNTQWMIPTKGKIIVPYSFVNKGVGISGQAGQPIIAINSGNVVYSGNGLQKYGNLIIIKHNSTYLSAYAYNKVNLVKEGDHVERGQKIATMGISDSKITMLHFEVRQNGKPIDPVTFIMLHMD